MHDSYSIGLIAATLLGKTVEHDENGFTITTVITTYPIAVSEAKRLLNHTYSSIPQIL